MAGQEPWARKEPGQKGADEEGPTALWECWSQKEMVSAHQPIPQSLQPPARGGEETARKPGLLEKAPHATFQRKASHTNGTPLSITWCRCEYPGQARQASPAGGDPEQGKGWSRPMVQWWDEHPEAPLQHLGRAMGRCLGKAGTAPLHQRRFYGG